MIIESLKISEDHLCCYYKKIATNKISPTYDDFSLSVNLEII